MPLSIYTVSGIYGPSDHYFRYNDTFLVIGWAGGIDLQQGNWIDAAIALRKDLLHKIFDDQEFYGYGHIRVNKELNLSLYIIPEGTPFGSPEHKMYHGPPVNADSSRENFPILKENYDKIKKLSIFW